MWEADVGPNRVVCGPGCLSRLSEVVAGLGGTRVLMVTDAGLVASGHIARAVTALEVHDLEVAVFADVSENPTTQDVDRGLEAARAHRPDLLVGFGGGSAMDCAKGVNLLLTNGGRLEDYEGHGRAKKPMLPAVGVPTTAGTGSEAQSYALISDAGTHRKMAVGDRKARFHTVLLDAELVATAPRGVAAVTGIDAIGHAVESFVSTRRNPLSCLLAGAAYRRLEASYEAAMAPSPSLEVYGEMLLGAYLAGAAIEASMLGAAHATANPLTARYGIAHGVAVSLMLPHVVRFNGDHAGYHELASGPQPSERLAERLVELQRAGGLPRRLSDCGVERSHLEELAAEAAEQWTGGFNPRSVGPRELLALYEAAF